MRASALGAAATIGTWAAVTCTHALEVLGVRITVERAAVRFFLDTPTITNAIELLAAFVALSSSVQLTAVVLSEVAPSGLKAIALRAGLAFAVAAVAWVIELEDFLSSAGSFG